MSKLNRLATAGTVVLCLGPGLLIPEPATAQDVTGTWTATWAQAVRNNHDGSMEIQRWGGAVLELQQDGNKLIGTWTTEIQGRVTWQVEGSISGVRVTLAASHHDSDDPQLAQVAEMRWRGTVVGDRLEGEMTLAFQGADRPRPWRPWHATRAGPG